MENRKVKLLRPDITFRWFLNVFSIVLFILAVLEIIIIIIVNESLFSGAETYLQRRSETNVSAFRTLLSENGNSLSESASALLAEITDSENIRVELYDLNGENIRSSNGFSSRIRLDSSELEQSTSIRTRSAADELVMIMTVPLRDINGNLYGALRYMISLEVIRDRQVTLIIISFIAMLLVAAFVFISGQYFIQSIVKPVNTITQSAQMIAKGDFTIRTQTKYDDEIGKLSEAINNMAQELSKIDTLKNEFISSISHELRTPLTAIRGWNETILLCDPETDRDTIKKGLNVIDAETNRLAKMIEELLDYSKIQSGRFTISKSKVNLFTLLMDTLDVYIQKATAAGVEIKYDIPAFEPIITGDANRLKQVFINVLDNAVKHSKKDSIIEIRIIKQVDSYSVIFRDHGSGIKKEELPFIKGRFYKGSSTKPGSGLGLSICDEIVNLHGGALEINSIEGDGTTVSVTIPF